MLTSLTSNASLVYNFLHKDPIEWILFAMDS